MFVAARTCTEWYRTPGMGRCPCPVGDSPMTRDRRCLRPAIDKINMFPDQRCCQ
jgi:hypothetical protein